MLPTQVRPQLISGLLEARTNGEHHAVASCSMLRHAAAADIWSPVVGVLQHATTCCSDQNYIAGCCKINAAVRKRLGYFGGMLVLIFHFFFFRFVTPAPPLSLT